MLEGIFLLTIVFLNQPTGVTWNPYGPFEFTSYQDCLTAGELTASLIGEDFRMTCKNKATGDVVATWFMGPSGDAEDHDKTR